MRSSISVLTFDADGTVLDYRPKIIPFRTYRGSSDVAGLLELAPHRLKRISMDADELKVMFAPEIVEDTTLQGLTYRRST